MKLPSRLSSGNARSSIFNSSMASFRAIHAANHELVEAGSQPVGRLARDLLVVVAENGLLRRGEQERQRAPALREFLDPQPIDGRIHLRLEIVDPELVEVAQDDVTGPARYQPYPIVESLAEVAWMLIR